jgi:hypothetical protein
MAGNPGMRIRAAKVKNCAVSARFLRAPIGADQAGRISPGIPAAQGLHQADLRPRDFRKTVRITHLPLDA